MSEQPVRRRRRKRKKYGRLVKPVRYLIAIAAVLIGVGVFFKISDIQVEGNKKYSDAEILSAASLQEGKSLFFAERGAAEKRIYSELPYIDEVDIRIKAPDTIIINVRESSVAASLKYEDGYIKLSRSCKVLDISNQAGTLMITGLTPVKPAIGTMLKVEDADSAKLSYLSQLLTLLDEKGMISDVNSIDVSNVTDMTFKYQDRLFVHLSGYNLVEYKLEFFSGILEQIGPDVKGLVDLTKDREGHFIPE
jgi:cell division septal protein FtsQ